MIGSSFPKTADRLMLACTKSEPEKDEPIALFSNTHWSLVLRAQDESTATLNTLCEKYRDPLLKWLEHRRSQLHPLEPEDLVQGFLSLKLAQGFLKSVSKDKGKFRTFVLECLQNDVRDELRRLRSKKRGGDISHDSLNEN